MIITTVIWVVVEEVELSANYSVYFMVLLSKHIKISFSLLLELISSHHGLNSINDLDRNCEKSLC